MKYMRPPEPYFEAGKLCLRYDKPGDEAKFLIDVYPYLELNKYSGYKMDAMTYGRICTEIHYDICNLMLNAGYTW